jgi:hypothetical protein
MTKLDKDGDGKINLEEFRTLFKQQWNLLWTEGFITMIKGNLYDINLTKEVFMPVLKGQWHEILTIFKSIFSANMKPYAKRLQPVNQGPRGGFFDEKKPEGWKSRDTVPFKNFYRSASTVTTNACKVRVCDS